MSWNQQRDSLIEQTLAFVQSVTGKREETDPEAALARSAEPDMPAPAFAPQPRHVVIPKTTNARPPVSAPPQPFTPGDTAAEIRARVASFRAHQERFNREREEYFAATLARLRVAIKDPLPRPRD